MFCPAGYHPAAALWIEFLEHRLESSYASTTLHYRKPDFLAGVVRGSPLDICEHYFLKTLATVGFHLASPSGDVVRVHALLRDEHYNLLSVTGPYDSAWHAVQMQIEAEKSDDEGLELPSWFQSWPHEMVENDAWAETYEQDRTFRKSRAYSPFNDLKHHTLPFHFERHSYLVSSRVPTFALKSSLSRDVAPILKHYVGWAICLDDATYRGEWSAYLHREKELFLNDEGDDIVAIKGRPPLKAVKAAFEAMGFDKGDLSWAQVSAKIERETGHAPSAKALRNWRDDHIEEQKRAARPKD